METLSQRPVSDTGQGDMQVWPGAVHYPDFMKPSAIAWWGAFIEVRAKLPGQACDADIYVR